MRKILFKNDKQTYKANLHCHTTISDGTCAPEQIKEMYKARGYSIVAYTDHNILKNHSYLNDGEFLALNSCEVNVNQRLLGEPARQAKTYHFNLYSEDPGISQTPELMRMDYGDIAAINKYIQDRVAEQFLVCYNHPYWSMQTYEDYSGLKGCFAMEIYNNGCEVGDGYYGYNPQAYDEMLRCGNRLFCVSSDDNHNREAVEGPDRDSFGGFVMINADSLSYCDIIESLKAGSFYSSQGPEIYEISIDDGGNGASGAGNEGGEGGKGGKKLRIKCSDVCLIVVYTDTRACFCKKGNPLNEVEFTLTGGEKYIRVMCRDSAKHDANSSAYWL